VVRAVNKIGLERKGYTPEQLERVKQIHRVIYRSGLNRTQALEKLTAHTEAATPEFRQIIAFTAASERGLASGGS
ncbi:MAG: acyl-[acyl-carrier-protein]--UDP-N-acetylglucosamine O-acyltransferase, partial [Opitutaceae bacterium]|nr:acyl-[acyl-carrier-protein]--UDP-N-acetylglucosamine O-acyltransferase [Opitutaceae bacterium]